jgi:hypothetical protein
MRVCCASKPVLETHKAASIAYPLFFKNQRHMRLSLAGQFEHGGAGLVVFLAGFHHPDLLLKHA